MDFEIHWTGPHPLGAGTSYWEGGEKGVYIVFQKPDDVVYVGKAGTRKGAVSEARFNRGKYERRRKLRGLNYDENTAFVYSGHVSEVNLENIDDIEHLLISHIFCGEYGRGMVNTQNLYYEKGPNCRIKNLAEPRKNMQGSVPPCILAIIESRL